MRRRLGFALGITVVLAACAPSRGSQTLTLDSVSLSNPCGPAVVAVDGRQWWTDDQAVDPASPVTGTFAWTGDAAVFTDLAGRELQYRQTYDEITCTVG